MSINAFGTLMLLFGSLAVLAAVYLLLRGGWNRLSERSDGREIHAMDDVRGV